jgi:hypothetical protein
MFSIRKCGELKIETGRFLQKPHRKAFIKKGFGGRLIRYLPVHQQDSEEFMPGKA